MAQRVKSIKTEIFKALWIQYIHICYRDADRCRWRISHATKILKDQHSPPPPSSNMWKSVFAPAGWNPVFHLWFLKLPITRRSSSLRQLPGDREVSEAVPAQCSAGRRWNPSGCRAWGARRGGDSHLQSPSAWVSSLQRATQGRLRLFIRTFKGCYITRLNELFNGKDSSELFCLTGWFMREVQP